MEEVKTLQIEVSEVELEGSEPVSLDMVEKVEWEEERKMKVAAEDSAYSGKTAHLDSVHKTGEL